MINGLKSFFERPFLKNNRKYLNRQCKINENFIIMNQKEIYDFISGNNKFIELINISFILIKKYFPNSNIYLEFRRDPEFEELNAIFAYVYDGTRPYESNFLIFDEFSDEFWEFEKQYGWLAYYINITSGEEYFKKRLRKREI